MTIIKLFFLLVLIPISTHDKNVHFNYEIKYIVDNKETLWHISTSYPSLMLITNLKMDRHFIFYNGKVSDVKEVNHKIDYGSLEFKNDQNKNKKAEVEIIKFPKKENVDGYKCFKYHVKSKGDTFEIFITEKNKINNTGYINSLIQNDDSKKITCGLIVKVNIYNKAHNEFRQFISIQNISKFNKTIAVDFEKLDLMLRK